MDESRKFQTKSGYCHLLPDKIVLSRHGERGAASQLVFGNGYKRHVWVYSVLALLCLFLVYKYWTEGRNMEAIIGGVFTLLVGYAAINGLQYSATRTIYRHSIKDVDFIEGRSGLTRSRFVVHFTDDKGRAQKRLLLLPGSSQGGKAETEMALEAMKEEKLYPFDKFRNNV
jgi:hypothetical protein